MQTSWWSSLCVYKQTLLDNLLQWEYAIMLNIAYKRNNNVMHTHLTLSCNALPIRTICKQHISSSTVPTTLLLFFYCQHLNLLNSRNPHKFQEILSLFWYFYLDFFFFYMALACYMEGAKKILCCSWFCTCKAGMSASFVCGMKAYTQCRGGVKWSLKWNVVFMCVRVCGALFSEWCKKNSTSSLFKKYESAVELFSVNVSWLYFNCWVFAEGVKGRGSCKGHTEGDL